MAVELMRRTKVLILVSGMLRISSGNGPLTLAPLYTMYVVISVPKNRHSEPMNAQKPIFQVSKPVDV